MTKAFNKYLDDPALAGEPEAMREIHAIRLQIHDERKGMTPAEFNIAVRKGASAFLAPTFSEPPQPAR